MATGTQLPTPEPLVRLGWDEGWAAAARARPPGRPGRVTRVDRGIATVVTAQGLERVSYGGDLLRDIASSPVAAPATGDWVLVRAWPDDRTTLETVLARRTAVVRASPGRRSDEQVLAANASVVGVVVALVPDPGQAKVERLLAVASVSGARPLLLVTKADAVSDGPDVAAELAGHAPGVETVLLSARSREGLERVRACVAEGGTLVLLGSSGAGKSTLVNALVGTEVLRTREIRTDGRGRHTTARRELVPLPGGGCVIDTPGLRGVGLVPADDGVAAAFADVDALAAGCRFDDCAHGDEPGCAVVAAVESGDLPPRRLDAWQRLQRELAWRRRRTDARLRGRRRPATPAPLTGFSVADPAASLVAVDDRRLRPAADCRHDWAQDGSATQRTVGSRCARCGWYSYRPSPGPSSTPGLAGDPRDASPSPPRP